MADRVPTKEIYEAEGVTSFARVTHGSTGTTMLQADFTDAGSGVIVLQVYDITSASQTPTTLVDGPANITVSAVVFDALQTDDDAYSLDSTGYNFKHTYDGSGVFVEGGRMYLLEYKLEFDSLPDKFLYFRVKTLPAWSQ